MKVKILRDWADVTTCHGVQDVLKSQSRCGKVCWTSLVTIFLLIMILQLVDLYKTFSMHCWVTTVYEETSSGKRMQKNIFVGKMVNAYQSNNIQTLSLLSKSKYRSFS